MNVSEGKRVKNLDPWLSVKDAAEYLNCSVDLVYDLVRRGEIPHSRLSRKAIRLRVSSLECFMNGRTPERRRRAS